MPETFPAIVIEDQDGKPKAAVRQLKLSDLPDHEVLVEVACSSLNYKDGLAVLGKGIARRRPLIAGIDLAGTVVESRSPAWVKGDRVVVNGWGLSETENGGFSRFQRVKPEWIVRAPDAFSLDETMAIGTAGYTAALAIDALEHHGITPGEREVLVTGAAGGLGSVAVMLLAKAGYKVAASTGRPETEAYLRELGASAIIPRADLQAKGGALQKERWAAAIDSVGSDTLVNVLAQTAEGGAVAACGLAGGADLNGTVMPYILRGVSLLGIESVRAPLPKRERAWARLARDLDRAALAKMTTVEPMTRLPKLSEDILAGQIRGRVVIDVAR